MKYVTLLLVSGFLIIATDGYAQNTPISHQAAMLKQAADTSFATLSAKVHQPADGQTTLGVYALELQYTGFYSDVKKLHYEITFDATVLALRPYQSATVEGEELGMVAQVSYATKNWGVVEIEVEYSHEIMLGTLPAGYHPSLPILQTPVKLFFDVIGKPKEGLRTEVEGISCIIYDATIYPNQRVIKVHPAVVDLSSVR